MQQISSSVVLPIEINNYIFSFSGISKVLGISNSVEKAATVETKLETSLISYMPIASNVNNYCKQVKKGGEKYYSSF